MGTTELHVAIHYNIAVFSLLAEHPLYYPAVQNLRWRQGYPQ